MNWSGEVEEQEDYAIMTNKEFAKKLEKRTREFAVQIIRLSARLP